MYTFSMIEDGPRGIEGLAEVDDMVDDLTTYGVDWQVAEDAALMGHLIANNVNDHPQDNPFAVGPPTLSHVECEPPLSPLPVDKVEDIDIQLAALFDIETCSMEVRRLVWQHALRLCQQQYVEN